MTSAIALKFGQRLFKTSAVARLSAIGLATCLIFTGCSNKDSVSQDQELAEQPLANTKQHGDISDKKPSAEADVEDSDVKGKSSQKESQPVRYDVESWKTGDIKTFGINDIDKMKRIFGKVVLTDDNSLDYASNLATKYRFMKGEEPYLDIIDSKEYLEYGWYFANPNDSDAEKKTSIDHAKKAFTVARGLMGEEGTKLVEHMLSGQIIKDKQVGDYQVALAKCEFYSCMLILKKPT